MRVLLLAPIPFVLTGCASIGIGAFIVTPILFMAFVIACIWALVRLILGSTKKLDKEKFEHQKEMDQRTYELMRQKHIAEYNPARPSSPPAAYTPTLPSAPPPAYTPTLPTPQPVKAKEIQECPFCKEDIIVGAVICKHCRSSL